MVLHGRWLAMERLMRQRRTLGQSVQVGRFNMKHLMCAGQCAPQLVEVALVSCRRCCDCSAAVLSLLFSGWFMILLFYGCGRLCLLVRDKLLLYSLRCLLPWLFCSCSCFLSPWWLLLPVASSFLDCQRHRRPNGTWPSPH